MDKLNKDIEERKSDNLEAEISDKDERKSEN
jgi:hypothetical protein